MTQPWDEHLMLAKYHYSIAKRLLDNFNDYETKRFLSSCLTEMALSASSLVNTTLIFLQITYGTRIPVSIKSRIEIFKKNANKEFGNNFTENTLTIFKIKKAQKNSPIELLKKDKILLLDNGEYKALTINRMHELLTELDKNIKEFNQISNNNN